MNFGIIFLLLVIGTAAQIQNVKLKDDNGALVQNKNLVTRKKLSEDIREGNYSHYRRRKLKKSRRTNHSVRAFDAEEGQVEPLRSVIEASEESQETPSANVSFENSGKGEKTSPKELRRKGRKRRGRYRHRHRNRQRNDISLWIDEKQVQMFSGYNMEIHAIIDGRVMPYLLHPDFEKQLPVIPSEVEHVNFTWMSGGKRYFYHFDTLTSYNQTILQKPFVSIRKRGRVPRKPKVFSVRIPCAGNVSGVAAFGIGLRIQSRKGIPLPDTPLSLRLWKRCELEAGPHPACDEKCANGGVCDEEKRCRCPMGYMGQFCNTALCYPQCLNGGICSSPGRCSCPLGYHGRICEGGICRNKCLNGGKCVQKDTCACQRGYYGNRCEFSKCVIPCVNGGKCRGVNKCRCKPGFSGNHCEIITTRGLSRLHNRCSARCHHGSCVGHGICRCKDGYTGKWCRRRGRWRKRKNQRRRKKLWV